MIKNTSLLVLIILLATSCKTNTKETPIDENEKLESNNEWINIFRPYSRSLLVSLVIYWVVFNMLALMARKLW